MKRFNVKDLWFLALVCLLGAHGVAESTYAVAGELKQGRYIGWVQLEPSQNKIAVVAEFYLESPEDLTLFPALHASFKFSLGGYNTHEYMTESFKNLRYDFENGILTLDDPKNDLVLSAEIHNVAGIPRIVGDAFIRSSAMPGKLTLIYDTDEPEEGPNGDTPTREEGTFLPLLDGQYDGVCEKEEASIQLQTARGLKTVWQDEEETSSLSRYYGISARIGERKSIMCGSLTPDLWCSLFNYGGGSYNFYQGKLLLKGASATDECTVEKDTLKCQIRRSGFNKDCVFKKNAPKIKQAKFFSRRFNLLATPQQAEVLPPADPPKSTELAKALRGTFEGYVHNETNDTYHYLKLNVIPFTFTDNPHNPNQMMVTTTATVHLGRDGTGPFITQRYEPRSFYLRPGFTLSGPTTDSYINVIEWKQGFIRGNLYSHAFGKVGSVQLVKGKPAAPPAEIEMVRSFAGEYDGPVSSAGISAGMRWFRFLFPAQPNDMTDHLIRFSGSYNPAAGILANRNIDRGMFDPFAGTFSWIIEKDNAATFSTGYIDKDLSAKMYWPPAPDVYGAQMADYVPETFRRK